MALINCTECNAQISDKAKQCPKCGSPITIKETFKCFECDAELEKGTKECSNCGAEQEVKKGISEESKNEENVRTPISPIVERKRSKLLMWILIIVGALALIIIVAILIKNENSSDAPPNGGSTINSNSLPSSSVIEAPREKKPEELREELLNKEQESPSDYLTLSYKLDVKIHLLKVSEDIINGTIYNSATMATFKDIVLKVKFLTNTDAVLDSKSYTLYEYVSPNGSKDFQIKVVSPSGTKKISAEIFKASADK